MQTPPPGRRALGWAWAGWSLVRSRWIRWPGPKAGLPLPGRRQHELQVLPQGVVVLAEQPLTFEQGLEPLGELALKNGWQLNDQLVQLRQLAHALLQLLAGSRQGRGQLRGWGLGRARGARDPWRWLFRRGGLFRRGWLFRGGWLFLGGRLFLGG